MSRPSFQDRITLSRRSLLDMLDGCWSMHKCRDEDARRMDLIGIDLASGHEVLNLGDCHLCSRRHDRIEIAGGLSIDEITLIVALVGVNQRNIREQSSLHDVMLAVELLNRLSFGNQSAKTSLCEEGGNSGATGSNAFRKRPLRVELEFEFAGQKLLGEQLVLANIGRDHLTDLTCLEKRAETNAVDAGIV